MQITRGQRAVFIFATLLAALSFIRRWFDALASHDNTPVIAILVDEFSAAWLAALLLLPLLPLARRYPPWRWPYWPGYAVGALCFAALHTLSMLVSRTLLYPLLNLGSYRYGDLGYRFVMEAPPQLLVFIAVLVGLYFLRQQEQAREAERLRGLLAESQLQSLRLQLAPHFLFNALNTISAVVYESPAKADELIGRLSRLLRTMLNSDNQALVTLDQELAMAREYVTIQQARFEHRLQYHAQIAEDHYRYQVPNMILQPLIENAFKYGVSEGAAMAAEGVPECTAAVAHVGEHLSIEISSELTPNALVLRVRDRGPGPGQRNRVQRRVQRGVSHGLGLANIRERLQLIYGERARLILRAASGGGAVAEVYLPRVTGTT